MLMNVIPFVTKIYNEYLSETLKIVENLNWVQVERSPCNLL